MQSLPTSVSPKNTSPSSSPRFTASLSLCIFNSDSSVGLSNVQIHSPLGLLSGKFLSLSLSLSLQVPCFCIEKMVQNAEKGGGCCDSFEIRM